MASISTLQASSSSSNPHTYDVFLSFRGEDTRKTFTGHLYANLVARGIHTFRDDEELEKGGDIASDLSRAIEESKIFVVIFSKRYADSKWCLNELVKIIDCKTEKGSVVLPVFYHVEPTDVRKQEGSFKDAFLEHAKDADQEKEKTIETWKNALMAAANLSGFHLKNEYEADFIQSICEDIIRRLNRKPLHVGDNIVGMDFHVEKLKLLIKTESDEVHMVGIYGTGGIGKTTISMAIYNGISSQFDGSSFLENVGGQREDGLLKLQKKLLQDTLKCNHCNEPNFNSIREGINVIKQRLRLKRVLIVLDDVDKHMQLENLAGKYGWYGAKSIIIITTKNKQLLIEHGVEARYEVNKLNDEKSAELFNWYAFKQNIPIPKFESLSDSIVKYADGLPIALKVLGVFLFKRSTKEWQGQLQKLQEMPHKEVQNVLKVSYDELDGREQGAFLDIACFFRGEDKNFVSRILGSDAEVVIKVLEDRCLITISENMLDMHDLLQQMGREVVRQEGLKESHKYPQEPGKRSRLWDPKDVESMLTRNTGTKAIEGLFVGVSTSNQIQFSTNFFVKMKSLRLLKVYHMIEDDLDDFEVDLPEDFEIPSFELRYLHFERYRLQCLPRNFHAKNLVELDLIHSSIKQLWKENEILDKLKVINLSYSKDLVEIPDFSSVPNLEILILAGCTRLHSLPRNFHKLEHLRSLSCKGCSKLKSFPEIKGNMSELRELNLGGTPLMEVPSSIGHLKALQHLDLSYCKSLRSLSESICNLSFLETLILRWCSNLKGFPEIKDDMKNLKRLDLRETGIEELPSSIGHLKALQHLDLSNCKSLRSLPECICNLSSLETLTLWGCSNLKGFPEIKGYMEKLEDLSLGSTGIEELPSSIGHLKALQHLGLPNCKSLRSLSESICNLSSLEYLILGGCSNLKGFPEIKDDMENLKWLDLRETDIEELPSSIGHLKALQRLDLCRCESLRSLPESICNLSSLETLTLWGCSNFKGFPKIKGYMENLEDLSLGSTGIEELPSSIGHLKALKRLNLSYCKSLRSLPESICNLSSLATLILEGCSYLKGFPEIKDDMKNLKGLDLSYTGIEELPSSIGHLKALQRLNLKCCTELVSLPDSICNLSSLETLIVKGCSNLKGFPEINDDMENLKWLDLSFTGIEELPIGHLKALQHLDLSNCESLRSLLESICNLSSLDTLIVKSCSNLKGFLEIKDDMENLKWLDLSETDIEELPSSIGHLKALQHLDLCRCESLRSLPESICNLSSLETLILEGCSKLKGFPEIKDDMENLEYLYLGSTGIEELPSSIGHLKALKYLNLSYCKSLRSLPESICNLSSLEILILERCSNLKGFPEIKDDMKNLKGLDLGYTGIEELPSSIGRLKALKHLNLKCCTELVSLPDSICNLSSLKDLSVQQCPKLERVEVNLVGSLHLTCWILKQRVIWCSSNLRHDEVVVEGGVLNHHVSSLSSLVESCTRDDRGIGGDCFHLSALEVFSVGNFSPIQRRILSDILRQSTLKIVSLRNCNLMEEGILSGFWNLSSLENLSLSNCSLTEGEILNHICHLSSLQNLSLDGNHFSSIPANIIQLSKLRSLHLNHCLKLLQIPELPPSLRVLDVHDCPCLETLSSPSSLLGLSLFKCFESAIEEWSYCQKKVEILMPGNNGIPEWISQKEKGSEIVVELPENWWEDNNFLGFALCSVFVLLHIESKEDSCLKCEMNFPHYFEYPDGFVTEFWSVDELSFRRSYPCCHNGGETNKVWVAYYPKVAIENKNWSNEWRHLKASFYGEEVKVEECGLHLIYKTNILNRDSNATNHWPRLLSENTDSNIELFCKFVQWICCGRY